MSVTVIRWKIICLLLVVFWSCGPDNYVKIETNSVTSVPEEINMIFQNDSCRRVNFYTNGAIKNQYISIVENPYITVIRYFKDGLVESRETFRNDTLHGENLNYFKNGQLRSRIMYENDEIKSLIRYNRDGTKQGEKLMYAGSDYYKRIWTYDSSKNATNVFTGIWAAILPDLNISNHLDSFTIDFHLPLDNEEFDNSNFRIEYTIRLLNAKNVIYEEHYGPYAFTDGTHTRF